MPHDATAPRPAPQPAAGADGPDGGAGADGREAGALLDLAVELVTAGGRLAVARQAGVVERTKAGADSLAGRVVTDVDVEVEHLVDDELARRRPDDAFLGEEFADRPGSSGLTWLLDPVDGTLNYARSLGPWSCVLSAWRGAAPEVVAVWTGGRVWTAARGRGAFLDGQRLRLPADEVEPGGIVQASARLAGAVAAAGWLTRVVDSSAAQVAQVADGRVVGSLRLRGDPRDLHAPALLVAEAGGVVTDLAGGAWDRTSGGLVVARAGAHAGLLRLVRDASTA